MTKKEFASVKAGQLIIIKTKKERIIHTVHREPISKEDPKIITACYGILHPEDVDFVRKSDIEKLIKEENDSHNATMERLNRMLKEAK